MAERLVIETELSDMKNDLADVRDDLSKSQAKEEESREVSLHDALTGLSNRVLFKERLDHGLILAKRHSWKLAVLFNFSAAVKSLNDESFWDCFMGDSIYIDSYTFSITARTKALVLACGSTKPLFEWYSINYYLICLNCIC